jgi:hypothetical protein
MAVGLLSLLNGSINEVERTTGFEPATLRFRNVCTAIVLHPRRAACRKSLCHTARHLSRGTPMAGSSVVGKPWLRDQIADINPDSIVDVGPGMGTYWELLSSRIEAYWIAVEIWGPYAEKFGLYDKYNEVIIGDVRWIDWDKIGLVDVVIFGDVLEHMSRQDALAVWTRARRYAQYVALSIPIVEWEQGPSSGNRYESHITTWTHADCLALPGVYAHRKATKIGAYLARGAQI